jgi:hypothetical protein
MKKFTIMGLVVLSCLMFFGTCSMGPPESEDEVVYTNVKYSDDYSQVTVYLDGTTFPEKRSAQRAMNINIARMSYDYLEAVFVSGSTVARAAWELGQPAGISGVVRNATPYAASGTQAAILIAGKKNGRTLLGIGPLISTRNDDGTAGGVNVITDRTAAVTFELKAVNTTLTGTLTGSSFTLSGTGVGATSVALGDGSYPMFSVPANSGATAVTYDATFTFGGGVGTGTGQYGGSLKFKEGAGTSGATANDKWIEHRAPRIYYAGAYRDLKDRVDYLTKVKFRGAYLNVAANDVFNPSVLLTVSVPNGKNGGVFSFFLNIPVYALDNGTSANGGPAAETWYIRSGFGPDLYNLDDGYGAGGSILMGVGMTTIDWIEIEWQWASGT